jgi:hypothetical protein
MRVAKHTPIVRISPRAHDLLRRLAAEQQQSMQAVLDEALERYRRERFLRGANADFEGQRNNPKVWKEELRERKLWEQTLSDGLRRE